MRQSLEHRECTFVTTITIISDYYYAYKWFEGKWGELVSGGKMRNRLSGKQASFLFLPADFWADLWDQPETQTAKWKLETNKQTLAVTSMCFLWQPAGKNSRSLKFWEFLDVVFSQILKESQKRRWRMLTLVFKPPSHLSYILHVTSSTSSHLPLHLLSFSLPLVHPCFLPFIFHSLNLLLLQVHLPSSPWIWCRWCCSSSPLCRIRPGSSARQHKHRAGQAGETQQDMKTMLVSKSSSQDPHFLPPFLPSTFLHPPLLFCFLSSILTLSSSSIAFWPLPFFPLIPPSLFSTSPTSPSTTTTERTIHSSFMLLHSSVTTRSSGTLHQDGFLTLLR